MYVRYYALQDIVQPHWARKNEKQEVLKSACHIKGTPECPTTLATVFFSSYIEPCPGPSALSRGTVDPLQDLRCTRIASLRVTVAPHEQRATGRALCIFVRAKCLRRSFFNAKVTGLPFDREHSSHLYGDGGAWDGLFFLSQHLYSITDTVRRLARCHQVCPGAYLI